MMTAQTGATLISHPPVDPAWDEAFLRVEGYLRAHGLESSVRLNRITAEIIRRTQALAGGGEEPVSAAMNLTHGQIGAWLAQAGPELGRDDAWMPVRGRLAMKIADLPGRWAHQFLSPGPIPRKLAAALGSGRFHPGPELRLSAMPPAPLEFGWLKSVERRLRVPKSWLRSRVLASWLLIAGLFGIAWAASR